MSDLEQTIAALRFAEAIARDPAPDETHYTCNALGKAGERYRVDLRGLAETDPRFAPLGAAIAVHAVGEPKRAAIRQVIDRLEGERLAGEIARALTPPEPTPEAE